MCVLWFLSLAFGVVCFCAIFVRTTGNDWQEFLIMVSFASRLGATSSPSLLLREGSLWGGVIDARDRFRGRLCFFVPMRVGAGSPGAASRASSR
jgi:hypothetical protein